MRPVRVLGLLLLPFLLAACVELQGQRIVLHHDAEEDELQVLLFYDGIHESTTDSYGDGADQIPAFVANRDVLIFDWFGHLQLGGLRDALTGDPGGDPTWSALWKQFEASYHTEAAGHYRDDDGNLGAAQLVSLREVSTLLERSNRAIDAVVVRYASLASSMLPSELAMTEAMWIEAARAGHAWISLDGHALVFTFPAHPREWARAKHDGLTELVEMILREGQQSEEIESELVDVRRLVQLLTTWPISYQESDGSVRITLGDPARSEVLRVRMRDRYEASLEPVVLAEVPEEMRAMVVQGGFGKRSEVAQALAAWAPPEEQALALVEAASEGDGFERGARVKEAQGWAQTWNRENGRPEAPDWMPDPGEEDFELWTLEWWDWYGAMLDFPSSEPLQDF